jgi:hypothetical protein
VGDLIIVVGSNSSNPAIGGFGNASAEL